MILKAWGSWKLFQSLLAVLKTIGDKYEMSIANIATRWVLDHDFVGAVLVGADENFPLPRHARCGHVSAD